MPLADPEPTILPAGRSAPTSAAGFQQLSALSIVYTNACSLQKKMTEMQSRVCELRPQLIIVTETWLHDGVQDAEIHLDGYTLFRQDRSERRGGGIVIYVESALNPTYRALPAEAQPSTGFEAIICELHTNQSTLPVLAVYRSPNASEDDHDRLFKAMDFVFKPRGQYLIISDFNAPLALTGSLSCHSTQTPMRLS